MAKIFRTEELSLNGDNIRIKSADTNKLTITSADGSNVFFRQDDVSSLSFKEVSDISSLNSDTSSLHAQVDSDVSSLQAQREVDVSDLEQDVSSLSFKEISDVSSLNSDTSSLHAQVDSDVSSLQAQRETDVSDLDQDVSSLSFKEIQDVSSLYFLSQANDVRVQTVALATNETSKTVTFPAEFPSGATPSVVGLIKAGANDPIIGVQLSAVSLTEATFQFSDEIPHNGNTDDATATNYSLVVMASA